MNCSATITSQMLSFPPVPDGHSLRCNEPLEWLLTHDPRNSIELTKCVIERVAENHSARRGGLTRARTCRCNEGIALKNARPGIRMG
jgi:hypothetical protein